MATYGETVRTPDGQLGTVAQPEMDHSTEFRALIDGKPRKVEVLAVVLESREVRFYLPEALTVLPGPL